MKKILLIALFSIFAFNAYAQRIKEIQVNGNGRMSVLAIKSNISYRIGDKISNDIPAQIKKDLLVTSNFKSVDVKISTDGIVTISVDENPIYNNFEFSGNKNLKSKDLIKFLGLRIRSVHSPKKLDSSVQSIIQFYKIKGYLDVEVSAKIIPLTNNRIDVLYTVTEGKIASIKKITISGNTFFSDSEIKDKIISKEYAWWRFLTDSDVFEKNRLEADKQIIRNLYRNYGFKDIRIANVEYKSNEKLSGYVINYTIEQGKRYKMGLLSIGGFITGMNQEKLNDLLINADKNGYYYAKGLQTVLENITKEISQQGFVFLTVKPNEEVITRPDGEKIINMTFEIAQAPQVFIEKIVIRGNSRTYDKIIRRKIKIIEGDPFNPLFLRNSEKAINRLGYFSSVKMTYGKGSNPNKVLIYIDVVEKSTGSAGFGVGYSSLSGALYKVYLNESNFLGRGQAVSVSAEKSGDDVGGKIRITQPNFLNRNMSGTVYVQSTEIDRYDTSSYKAKEHKAGVSLQYDLNDKWMQTIGTDYRYYDLSDVKDTATLALRNEKGITKGVSISHSLQYSDTDNYYSPRDGIRMALSTNIKSIGTEYKHLYNVFKIGYYIPIGRRVDFKVSGSVAKISDYKKVRFGDRLYLSTDHVRGFTKMGPVDSTTGDLLGGTLRHNINAEFAFPIGLPDSIGIKGTLFASNAFLGDTPVDDGYIADATDVNRNSIGAGIKWASPLGPMRFDYVKIMQQSVTDTTKEFQFTIGFSFY